MKKEINETEILFYLEEMMQLELCNSLEEEIYHSLIEELPVHSRKLNKIKKRIHKWYELKF